MGIVLAVVGMAAPAAGDRISPPVVAQPVVAPSVVASSGPTGQAPGKTAAVRVGWCSKALGVTAAPLAVAMAKGWFSERGLAVEVVALGGSSACAAQVAKGDVPFALTSIEAAAVLRAQGVAIRNFYTAYQSNIYGMAVPAGSTIRAIADLKGKRIGVAAHGSASAVIARQIARDAQLDPDRDLILVPTGNPVEAAQSFKNGALDALSMFDTHFALVERAGVPLRRLPHPDIDHFPANGFVALEQTLASSRSAAVALARGYAMGTIFATANPEEAVRLAWAAWPAMRGAARDEVEELADGVATLKARAEAWRLDRSGAKLWGEHVEKHVDRYLEWLQANGFVSARVAARDLVTSDLLKDVNDLDAATAAAGTSAAKP